MSDLRVKRRRRLVSIVGLGVVVAVVGSTAAACTGSSTGGSQQAVNASNSTAQKEYTEFTTAVPYPFANTLPSDPLERKNLAKRLVQYNSKGDTNYVYVMTFSGAVIGYYVISGKVSSTSSQMTSTTQITNCGTQNNGDGAGCAVSEAIGDDGSYGPEEGGDFGVFFFTSTGILVETDQPVLVSSAPISIYASVPQLDAPAKK